jgi:glycosyltransferase involved in cell wall biosynthesis
MIDINTAPSTIALITVCRNPGLLLPRVIASVAVLQDARVFHYIVDGASSDGTRDFLRDSSHGLAGWISEPDSGIYDAMNKGWHMAPDDSWVLFLGADDRIVSLPSDAELLSARVAGNDIVYGTTQLGGRTFRSRWNGGLRLRNTVHHQSMLVRKAVAPAPPFDTRLRVYGDWDFNLRLWRRGVRATFVPSLRAAADSGGLSASRPLGEAYRIAASNGNVAWGLCAVVWLQLHAWRSRITGQP